VDKVVGVPVLGRHRKVLLKAAMLLLGRFLFPDGTCTFSSGSEACAFLSGSKAQNNWFRSLDTKTSCSAKHDARTSVSSERQTSASRVKVGAAVACRRSAPFCSGAARPHPAGAHPFFTRAGSVSCLAATGEEWRSATCGGKVGVKVGAAMASGGRLSRRMRADE
jgi:hypothetical protein